MASDAIIHIVDDDEAMRDSLAFLLHSAGMAAQAHELGYALLDCASGTAPACVITDVRMPEMNGIELLRRLRALWPNLPVIVMTGHGDIPLAVEAMKAGATDFIEKPFDDEAMLRMVKAAVENHESGDRRAAERTAIAQRLEQISGRERQVLEGLIAGKANKVIAFELDISPRTVEVYRANLMTKMQASSLSELVRMAVLSGLTDEWHP